ncbi:hypothetical protein [Endozoicomonas sp. SESOKO1]|uniref:hypothetical protein n=1 Tax=Endozoicomonas sp. SESOKO1 TaxID=2828742 RepID=UPI00214992DA|nr:hypothetical protein [Endozoicomonas sp. SESOKO1]
MKKIHLFPACSFWIMAALAETTSQSNDFKHWARDNCRDTVGDVFIYHNNYTGKTNYFQLATLGPNGGLCPYFPTNETSSFYWQYLPDEAAAEAAAAANATLQKRPPITLAQIDHPPSVTPPKTPATTLWWPWQKPVKREQPGRLTSMM